MLTKIELDVFSGRPNPVWELNLDEIGFNLETLPVIFTEVPLNNLGYRGIKIGEKYIPAGSNVLLEELILSKSPDDVKTLIKYFDL